MWFARDLDEAGKEKYVNDLQKSMFVAATRTKGNLYLTYSQHGPFGHPQTASRFLRTLKY